MKGFVPTPPGVVDLMVGKLFAETPPQPDSRVLDPGCGPGAFVAGILRWCAASGVAPPQIVGVEADSARVTAARREFSTYPSVEIRHANFLSPSDEQFDFVVGNPPYVSIGGLSEDERHVYRREYQTATNRFDLYGLFFEQALRQLRPQGRLVFITPEKFLYVESAAALRRLMLEFSVDELHYLHENTFADLVTYPLVTTISKRTYRGTSVVTREGATRRARLPTNGLSWLAAFGDAAPHQGATLADICTRISCGVATGADAQFVIRETALPAELRQYSYPTISGRQLVPGQDPVVKDRMLVPYDRDGALLPERSLGRLGLYLSEESRKAKLLARVCVRVKPWFAFHENPPLRELLKPKLLCKDIGSAPHFFIDREGTIVPRHSVYYVIPRRAERLPALLAYLNSTIAQQWLLQNCQRAAKGFVRLQSHVLKRLPIPAEFQDQLSIAVQASDPPALIA